MNRFLDNNQMDRKLSDDVPSSDFSSHGTLKCSMDTLIITRFNYRFKETDPLEPLICEEYWRPRFELFKKFCFPSVVNQTNPDFTWIIIIDPLLPSERRQELTSLTDKDPRIILYEWRHGDSLSNPEWIQRVRPLTQKLLLTMRLDNDDAIAKDLVERLQTVARTTKINGFLLVSWSHGYTWNSNFPPANAFKAGHAPMIALGLSLITYRDKYPLTVYMGRHTKLLTYLKHPQEHKILRDIYEQTGEINLAPRAQLMIARQRYLIIRRSPPAYIRTVHDHNHQKNLIQSKSNTQVLDAIKRHFVIDL